MKKIISLITAFVMLSSLSMPFAFAEESDMPETTETGNESDLSGDSDLGEIVENVWKVSADEPADADFNIDEERKEYSVLINNPGGAERGGTDKWDLQFRIKGLSIEEGHEYRLTYRISASNAGNYYTKISNYDSSTVGDAVAGEVWHNQLGISTMKSYINGILKNEKETSYGESWSLQPIEAGDSINVTCKFKAIATLPEAEWAFFLGGAGATTPNDCFPEGTEIRFSNLTLLDTTDNKYLVDAFRFIDSDVKGDINGDGVADMSDLTVMCQAKLGEVILDDAQITNADVDGSGCFDLMDIPYFLRYVSGKTEKL